MRNDEGTFGLDRLQFTRDNHSYEDELEEVDVNYQHRPPYSAANSRNHTPSHAAKPGKARAFGWQEETRHRNYSDEEYWEDRDRGLKDSRWRDEADGIDRSRGRKDYTHKPSYGRDDVYEDDDVAYGYDYKYGREDQDQRYPAESDRRLGAKGFTNPRGSRNRYDEGEYRSSYDDLYDYEHGTLHRGGTREYPPPDRYGDYGYEEEQNYYSDPKAKYATSPSNKKAGVAFNSKKNHPDHRLPISNSTVSVDSAGSVETEEVLEDLRKRFGTQCVGCVRCVQLIVSWCTVAPCGYLIVVVWVAMSLQAVGCPLGWMMKVRTTRQPLLPIVVLVFLCVDNQ